MSVLDKQVLVIGAGVGGLAAAIALRQCGADVTVLERADAPGEVGAGVQISPNGAKVLCALQAFAPLTERSPRSRAVVLRNHRRGDVVLRLDLTRLQAPDEFLLAHRADLITVLADRAHRIGVRFEFSTIVTNLTDPDTGRLRLMDGTERRADLVAIADGARSVLRPIVDGGGEAYFTGQVAWRAIVPNRADQPAEAHVHMGPGRHLVTYPLRDGTTLNLVAVQERRTWADEVWDHPDYPTNLCAAFADFHPEARSILDQVTDLRIWGLFRHPIAARWWRGKVVLVGDAAHPTLPFMAQGTNLALEDAWVLANSLHQAPDMPTALAAYQTARVDRVRRIIAAANRNAWAYHLRLSPVRWAAHLGLKTLGRVAPDAILWQFRYIYDHDVTR